MLPPEQLRQILKCRPPLVNDLIERIGWPNCTNDYLVPTRGKSLVRRICECIDGHS